MGHHDLQIAVSEVVNSLLSGKRGVRLLEAGCGSATHIKFEGDVHSVGVDISLEELQKNQSVQEKIVGDIQDCELPEAGFDIVICWMVLEHLPKPRRALNNLFRTVKPGGLLVLGFPNLLSIKGFVTKFTPFWFHELFYRYMRYTSRHFPTYLRMAILPGRVIRLAESSGFCVEYFKLIEGGIGPRVRSRFWIMDVGFATVDWVVRTLSFGRLQSPLLDNCGLILRKL